ncbi:KTSC domain-containing protein [Enterococcus casseliflavus]|uniref:KTSC domain-containing protein n=1 Tax=Enterococcus TaxID=1350 RepID=UPI002DBC3452|nr:KTSC domain-containing protein [Enterococcus casseliflavus]MEB6088046.1 KTSC domain-containing protein [Enterococcus casseliflavus]MEB8400277.1 KTSC domain-containing protein [Enterococcus casseliflavus]
MEHIYYFCDKIKCIKWFTYTLEVEFKDGSVYQYHSVSEAELRVLLDSASIYSALSRIKRIHPYNKI